MKNKNILFAILSFVLFEFSTQTDAEKCNKSSLTEIKRNICNDQSAQFEDQNYKCCWYKLIKSDTKYGCERIEDTETALKAYKETSINFGGRIDLYCDSVHDDATMCNTAKTLNDIGKDSCYDMNSHFKDKLFKCCHVKSTSPNFTGYSCLRIKDSAKAIQKVIDDEKKLGTTAEITCSSKNLILSIVIALIILLF